MIMKKSFMQTLVMLLAITLTFGTVALADIPPIEDLEGMMPTVPVLVPYYGSFAGTVKEILPSNRSANAVQHVKVENENGAEAVFLLSANTYWASQGADGSFITSVEVGDEVIGYYDSSLAIPAIYPPQYGIEIMVVNLPDGMAVMVDRFNSELVSTDGTTKIMIGEHTQVLNQEGELFAGDSIAGRMLVVFHSNVMTSSMPGQTMAWAIIVMYEKIVPLPIEIGNDPIILNGEIVVEGVLIDAPAPFVNDNGVVMVPLRAIAEALGYDVEWDDATRSVMLNNTISLSIGKDYYTYARMAPIELGTAPELVNDRTFVPLNFFSEVARVNNAYAFEGQVVVDNGEKMQ